MEQATQTTVPSWHPIQIQIQIEEFLRFKLLFENSKSRIKSSITNNNFPGNPLYCDEKLSWLVSYLVANQVRTFLPYQSEVLCAGPNKYEGVRLKELMIAKANETISSAPYSFDITSRKSGVGKYILLFTLSSFPL